MINISKVFFGGGLIIGMIVSITSFSNAIDFKTYYNLTQTNNLTLQNNDLEKTNLKVKVYARVPEPFPVVKDATHGRVAERKFTRVSTTGGEVARLQLAEGPEQRVLRDSSRLYAGHLPTDDCCDDVQ